MKKCKLGATGPRVSAVALGCMGMSDAYGHADRGDAIATIHRALDNGITLLDTGDFYGSGDNELLIAEALKGRARDSYQLSVKFGGLRDPAGGYTGTDARPIAIRNFLAYSLRRLRVDHIDIYRPARLDPQVPIEDTMGALADCVQKGWIGHIALSEVGADTIRRAAKVHAVVDTQVEYSLLSRGVEQSILPASRELGIATTAYGVLARGLLSGSGLKGPKDARSTMPRFQGEALAANQRLVSALDRVAAELGASATQLAIAWVSAQGDDIVPVVGARSPNHLAEVLAATDLALSDDALAAIENAIPKGAATGARYPDALLARLDSER